MESRKFIYYNHHTYGDRLAGHDLQRFSRVIDGNEYTIIFDYWEGVTQKINGFEMEWVFLVDPEWIMLNHEGEIVPIPPVERKAKVWFNDMKDKQFYNKLLDDIKREAFIDWIRII